MVDTVQTVLHHFLAHPDPETALVATVNQGDDADTTAAIAGQLAGARWGLRAIPVEWRNRITAREQIEAIAGRLFDGAATDVRR